jgi:iron complex outermembrane receptor protein
MMRWHRPTDWCDSGQSTVRANCLLSVAALGVLTMLAGEPAAAQDAAAVELPPVVVTAPSPVAKPKKRNAAPAPSPQPSAPPPSQASQTGEPLPVGPAAEPAQPIIEADPLPGTLLVVDDAFVPVTVASEREIEATRGSTITETLQTKPGISGTTFAPGSNRPIIRGLDTYRVRVQENGIGSGDVAALSEDHAVPIDPSSASRIEVIRGPATLRYGSQAIGGVVAVENGRIPTSIPNGGFSGEIRGGMSSVDEGRDGSFRATGGSRGIAVHADGFKRQSEDYDTPRGKQFNTFVDSEGGALGISMVGHSGFLGVSISHFDSLYGIPGEEAAEARPRIDLEQDKVQVKGEWRVQDFGLEALRVWFGVSDYKHTENINEDGDGFEVGQLFTNEEWEGRFEAQHLPLVTSLGTLRGAAGVQALNRETEGRFLEDGDSLLAPAETGSVAAFLFEELDVTDRLTLQAAVRIEHTEVDGFERIAIDEDTSLLESQSRDFTPVSVSLGGLYKLPGAHVMSLNGQYVERAPDAAELFSGGVHEATETFEIGDPNLDVEKAASIEAGLRKATGSFRYDATAFYTRYDGFIFKGITGSCGETIGSCVDDPEAEDLARVNFAQRDATFYGVELAAQYDVAPIWNGVWGVEAQYDFVNASFEGGGNVPRIPPHRLGGGLFYRDLKWFARAGVLHAFDQDRFAADFEEVATPGYTLVSAELSYTARVSGLAGLPQEITIGLKGENLADDEVLNHASFKRREDVLLPGASVRLFGSIKLN